MADDIKPSNVLGHESHENAELKGLPRLGIYNVIKLHSTSIRDHWLNVTKGTKCAGPKMQVSAEDVEGRTHQNNGAVNCFGGAANLRPK